MEIHPAFQHSQWHLAAYVKIMPWRFGIGFVELLECFGTDLTVANAARVSMHKESFFDEVKDDDGSVHFQYQRDKTIIHYLAQNRHQYTILSSQLPLQVKDAYLCCTWMVLRHTVGFCGVMKFHVASNGRATIPCPIGLRQRDKNISRDPRLNAIENNDAVAKQHAEMPQRMRVLSTVTWYGRMPWHRTYGVTGKPMYTEFIETASLAGYARWLFYALYIAQKEIREYGKPLYLYAWKSISCGARWWKREKGSLL